jgi:hypothetical protein
VRLGAAALLLVSCAAPRDGGGLPRFRTQVVDDQMTDLWHMALADINGDGKMDILALDFNPARVVWYENPTWKRHLVIENEPKALVALQALDVDGDGKTELILGAEYPHAPFRFENGGGGIFLLRRPDDLEKTWTPIRLGTLPTLHRIHLLDRKDLVCSALDGPTIVLRRPSKPFDEPWIRETVAEKLHACHNTLSIDWDGDGREEILTASREGVNLWTRGPGGEWKPTLLVPGNGGASEVAVGRLPGGARYLATIEPHHGAELCVYTEDQGAWKRRLLRLHKGGHTLRAVDWSSSRVDSLFVGFVGAYSNAPGGPCWYAFHPKDARGETWDSVLVDDQRIPGEDGDCADLNGDGRIDAVGAGGHSVKIYWNEGPSD